MVRSWLAATLLVSTSLWAERGEPQTQPTPPAADKPAIAGTRVCPNPSRLMYVCMNIEARTKDRSPIGYNQYAYYRKILDASCVKIGEDPEAVVNAKVQAMWTELHSEMKCNSTIVDISDASYLKYAVATKFDQFLEDAIEWGVDLNRVDGSDNRTVLDYVKFHRDRHHGSSIGRKMSYYYDLLREAGAKHKSEL
ncbi:hypothetical protein [Sphingopyxis sp. R3-92]|uniref:hypothetical protein n=1 Tax=Sphingopyxis sp. R3-92 TaxID=3158553 RepID=UPI003EE67D5C